MTTPSRTHLQNEICRFLSDMLGEPCSAHDDLRAKGLDSVGFLELLIFIEKQLAIPFPIHILTSAPVPTVEALIARLEAVSPSTFGVR